MAATDRARWRSAANWLNLATPCGLLLARATGCRVRSGPRGLYLALGYRLDLPDAAAFTVGNVVLWREGLDEPERCPGLIVHEERHASQYAWCLGLPFLPLYAVAAGYSWLRTGDPASRNVFERQAGLAAGGYTQRRSRPIGALLPPLRRWSRPRG
ncbi:MAG: hypothetical protein ACTHWW_05475 [Arthrobacter sp.]|uniref:hypothetical protein n=1 Tax=unclassified Arthrobacter TaxID=235627 RepID=UPI00264D9B21|nr:hypothetical protein [Micrococcaceae bacterium]MDN5811810.1 hypothetical protein [Micrococcaceae bacterium]MDN5822757.1 hypothetical protein [Micrococcaceae bacterium]MDN5878048.1 hypothetical protein [Micrococcaceae bacterium]MDN5885967.1 hypothetical protein [Micrococcaceae bacterium]